MTAVVLCVDVGNSHTVIGIYRGTSIIEYARLTTPASATSDEILLRMRTLVQASAVAPAEITHVGLSSVVPALERVWVKALHRLVHLPVSVAGPNNCLGLRLGYDLPAQLGADRICNVLAMRESGLQNGIVIDLGTAVTFDLLKDGGFGGGIILPGINSSLEVLTQKAVRLMPVSLEWTDKVVATNTDDAIRSGVLYGFLGQMEFLIDRVRKEMHWNEDIPVWATGGWSEMVANRSKFITKYDAFLTLNGIRFIALNSTQQTPVDHSRGE
jgi:type III pantothenate kinase